MHINNNAHIIKSIRINIVWLLLISFSTNASTLNFETPQNILQSISQNPQPILGMHDTLGGIQSNGFEYISSVCGVSLGLLSMDFGYSTHPNDSIRLRKKLLSKVEKLNKAGILFTLSWHQCNPVSDEPCTFKDGVQKILSEAEWNELLIDNSKLNLRWKTQVDRLATFLRQLQNKGIVVLLRPYHESNIPGFWWAHKDPERFISLWRQLKHYLTSHHKLNNIIWVWSVSYHPKYWINMANYYPGKDQVDIIGLDIYPPTRYGKPAFAKAWKDLKKVDAHKPIALSEISRLPSQAELQNHNWAYLVPWGKTMLIRDNTVNTICETYLR